MHYFFQRTPQKPLYSAYIFLILASWVNKNGKYQPFHPSSWHYLTPRTNILDRGEDQRLAAVLISGDVAAH